MSSQGRSYVKQALNHYDALKVAVQRCDVQAMLYNAEELGEKIQQAYWTAETAGEEGTQIRNEANVIDTFFSDFVRSLGNICEPKFARSSVEEQLRDVELTSIKKRLMEPPPQESPLMEIPPVLVTESGLSHGTDEEGQEVRSRFILKPSVLVTEADLLDEDY